MTETNLDLFGKLPETEQTNLEFRMKCVSPDDGKYGKASNDLEAYLSPRAEWLAFAEVQKALLETRVEYGKAEQKHLDEVIAALPKLSPENMQLLEDEVTKHDQLAVIEEFGRHISLEAKSMLHPGTTSYDIVDTARAYLQKNCWNKKLKPQIFKTIELLCELSKKCIKEDIIQVGRTHLQHTTPVPFATTLAGYTARVAERTEKADYAFNNLRGKISGIVGTGAGIETVIGKGKAEDFEEDVLKKLGLEPDSTGTQITQKERFADVGHYLTTLMHVLGDFCHDIRLLYSSDIQEVTSRDNAERLGGSSTDAGKNNPINYENIEGKGAVVESGMRVLYEMIKTDLQRDLRSSVQARYQPQQMMAEVYESFKRINKSLEQLSINTDRMNENLAEINLYPTEAMVTILKGENFIHSKYGMPHDFVKEMTKKAKKSKSGLLEISLQDEEFKKTYEMLDSKKKEMISGRIELYIGNAYEKAVKNMEYALETVELLKQGAK
ncbi:MAG: lyase family protein [Candidatus Nanoarchaeia archaeon]|nr:lyase family protein [Candidatus Nanoarchaeia archaeon]MDD5239688.1 lyase family protein [Candidatus Nanoarchaeia archaeon]